MPPPIIAAIGSANAILGTERSPMMQLASKVRDGENRSAQETLANPVLIREKSRKRVRITVEFLVMVTIIYWFVSQLNAFSSRNLDKTSQALVKKS